MLCTIICFHNLLVVVVLKGKKERKWGSIVGFAEEILLQRKDSSFWCARMLLLCCQCRRWSFCIWRTIALRACLDWSFWLVFVACKPLFSCFCTLLIISKQPSFLTLYWLQAFYAFSWLWFHVKGTLSPTFSWYNRSKLGTCNMEEEVSNLLFVAILFMWRRCSGICKRIVCDG